MITINFCGYDSMHKAALNTVYPSGYEDYTLLLIKTESFFEIDGAFIDMPPNTIMLYKPHSSIHYGCREPHYNDDWIHFELHDKDETLLEKLGIPMNKPFILPNMRTLTNYSKRVVLEKLSTHLYKKEVMDSLMHALLFSIANQLYEASNGKISSKYYHSMNKLRMEILNTPNKKWETAELSERIHLSISHFQHLYKEFFGVTCIQDIINARIRFAQFHLCTSEMSISSLASFCGYENELHFMRQFKKLTGMTPSQYRSAYRTEDGQKNYFKPYNL